ncbi:hypothetical protein CFP56_033647 [Quercus suber]|uniref:Uncharacterized protein n=1 Tax=Quercus suber TaxID=58331 RepID=A0AAW0JE26_QUESU
MHELCDGPTDVIITRVNAKLDWDDVHCIRCWFRHLILRFEYAELFISIYKSRRLGKEKSDAILKQNMGVNWFQIASLITILRIYLKGNDTVK